MRDNERVQSGLSKIGKTFQGVEDDKGTNGNSNIGGGMSQSSGGGVKGVIMHSLTHHPPFTDEGYICICCSSLFFRVKVSSI